MKSLVSVELVLRTKLLITLPGLSMYSNIGTGKKGWIVYFLLKSKKVSVYPCANIACHACPNNS